MLNYKKITKFILKSNSCLEVLTCILRIKSGVTNTLTEETINDRLGADCAKCLTDSVHVYVESQTFVQAVPKLLFVTVSNTPFV